MVWRVPPRGRPRQGGAIRVARWNGATRGREYFAEGSADDVVVAIAMGRGAARLTVGGREIVDGPVRFGSTHLAAVGREARCLWREPFESVHLFVPADLMRSAIEELTGRAEAVAEPLVLREDPALARLALLWLDLQDDGAERLEAYGGWLGAATLTRLVQAHAVARPAGRPGVAALPSWRVQRAFDYVEENLEKPVSLADMAASARLSPMHFAAQFRRATGLSPYQFVIRRRIERAQELLRRPALPLAEIALATGFSSQTHFTTCFRQVTGHTPGSWRQLAR